MQQKLYARNALLGEQSPEAYHWVLLALSCFTSPTAYLETVILKHFAFPEYYEISVQNAISSQDVAYTGMSAGIQERIPLCTGLSVLHWEPQLCQIVMEMFSCFKTILA